MASDVEEVARKLTKAQRRVMVQGIVGTHSTMRVLAERGLYYFGAKSIKVDGNRVSYVVMPDGFTELGEAVSRYLGGLHVQ